MAAIEHLRDLLATARSVFILTGAGISAESGLPTFRGAGGLWNTRRVEELASPQGFARDPPLVWRWYLERRAAHRDAVPSPAHRALAALEARIPDFTLATQNVDSLHLRAGSQNVLELHGNLREARCTACPSRIAIDEIDPERLQHPCGGWWRPSVVWFGEPLPADVFALADAAARRAEVILVVGTSAQVYPAAALADKRRTGAIVVEINPDATPISDRVDASFRAGASAVLTQVL